jgi:hypothetical protein
VKSDLAIWPISFKESGANLQTVLDQSEKDKGSVLGFLKSQGFTSQEISVGDLGVIDRPLQQQYRETGESLRRQPDDHSDNKVR